MAAKGQSSPGLYLAGFTLLYFAANFGLNICNKAVLQATAMPLFLTFTHMVFSFCVLLPFMLQQSLRAKHVKTLRTHWKGLVAIGCLMALNVSLSNASLVKLSLSLNQVIRASMPVMTAAMAYFIEKQKPTKSVVASLMVLSTGVGVCVWQGQASGTLFSIILCTLSTLANAACLSTSGKLLTEKIDVMRLTFYIAPITAFFILPLLLHVEARMVVASLAVNGKAIAYMFGLSSALAVTHNLVNYKLVQHTSAVSATVIGEIKTIALIILSAFLLGEKSIFTLQLTIGCVVAMGGFCWYSHCKLYERLNSQAAAAKDVSTSARNSISKPNSTTSPLQPGGHAAGAGLRGRTLSSALTDEEAPMAATSEQDSGEHRPLLCGGGSSAGARADLLTGAAFSHQKHNIAGGRLHAGGGEKAMNGYAGLLKAGLPGGVFRADVRANTPREQLV